MGLSFTRLSIATLVKLSSFIIFCKNFPKSIIWLTRILLWMIAGKFKGNQDTAVIDSNELRELLEMSDHQKIVSSDGLVISDKDLKALLDRSDLCTKDGQSKQQSQSKRNRNCGLFRVLDDTADS